MGESIFNKIPAGAARQHVPEARVAAARTSREIVGGGDPDAGYFRTLEASGILLNASQIAAVRHFKGPLLTLAGAGSGKTSVLICRTGYLLSVRRVDPREILLLTFSSKAAQEMRDRIAVLPGIHPHDVRLLQARTFHSFFLQLIRRQGNELEIWSETRRQHILLKQIMREMGLQDAYQPETLLSMLSSYKTNLVDLPDMPEDSVTERETKRILLQYEQWKLDHEKMDFDDVLILAYRLLKGSPSLLRTIQDRFRYIMVDEFQDTNHLQYELVKLIAAPQDHLMVVGDDDQTIYSFNGARSEYILEFEKTYPKAKVITLTINYRSGTRIVGLGNEVIRHNKHRRSKTLEAVRSGASGPMYTRPLSSDEEARLALDRIEHEVRAGRRNYGDYAVLYRATSNNRAILEQLMIREIPYIEYGDGQLLYENALVLPLVDHLRLGLNRRDFTAMESVLPTLYINRERGMSHIVQQESIRAKKGPLVHLLTLSGLKDFQLAKIQDRLELIRTLSGMRPAAAIARMREKFYNAYVEADERKLLTQHKEMIKEMLDELEASADRFDTVVGFLGFISDVIQKSREQSSDKSREQGNRVALMTIHRSKGLEFPVVMLIGAIEGSLPHSSAIEADRMKDTAYSEVGGASKGTAALEEERRLAYVAITRAKEELIISSPARYRGKKAAVSRFLLSAFGGDAAEGAATPSSASRARREVAAGVAYARSGSRAADGRSARSGGAAAATRTESVAAWLCQGPGCIAWTRVTARDHGLAAKVCPLCGKPMHRGRKDVPV
ncbi:UvrD-helicase domain-containing protein [Paenibacillus sp. YPG26]|uniref:UvrD-helicase domain-containing protein n=1 Tax=Paenibacillus sp. YPG26 TaxID=2878915 RepID=UPI00203F7B78|nr:UvrD-helicase domain-containing protein [Paenibacillus sp. YPG26]USB33576.1 UvrD-helicase domain-containing protein [Paenibacillus sp. YPG26]